MKARILTAAALVLTTATLFAADRTFERTLNTGSSPNVSVATGSGDIHLHPGSSNQVHIVANVHANHSFMSGDVDARVQQIADHPPIVQNGNDIVIGQQHNNDLYRNISISYDITLPRSSVLNVASGSGSIHVENVGAGLKAQTGSGDIRAFGIQGAATLGTGSGSIQFQQSSPGDVRAETGSGDIQLRGISGALISRTGSGGIDVQGQPTSDWKLSTGSGSVRLTVGNAHFNLDADTGSGGIHTVQPIAMQGQLNRHHVTGAVNGGGPTVRVRTGSGDISIN